MARVLHGGGLVADDPVIEMLDLCEEKVRNLMLAEARLNPVQVFYRGEPGIVPTRLYPFGVIFIESTTEAQGQDGYIALTGIRYYRFDGYISLEVLHRDAPGIAPTNRRADVPSYMDAKELVKGAFNAMLIWGGEDGKRVIEDPVVDSQDRASTVELRVDSVRYGMTRRDNNVGNSGTFEFHLWIRVQDLQ